MLIVRRQHVVLAVSAVTLLPVLVPAAPYKTMTARFVEATGKVLRALGIPEAKVAEEVGAMRELVVAPTNDRRVLGSTNDFAWMTQGYIELEILRLDLTLTWPVGAPRKKEEHGHADAPRGEGRVMGPSLGLGAYQARVPPSASPGILCLRISPASLFRFSLPVSPTAWRQQIGTGNSSLALASALRRRA